jgi:hypothetical protein
MTLTTAMKVAFGSKWLVALRRAQAAGKMLAMQLAQVRGITSGCSYFIHMQLLASALACIAFLVQLALHVLPTLLA